jgi:hypothetical protein
MVVCHSPMSEPRVKNMIVVVPGWQTALESDVG